jgi:hypothetical protein
MAKTRLGLSGITRAPYGSFAGKVVIIIVPPSVPVSSGVLISGDSVNRGVLMDSTTGGAGVLMDSTAGGAGVLMGGNL